MKKIKATIILLLIMCMFYESIHAQSYSARQKVYIPAGATLSRKDKVVGGCAVTIPTGKTLKEEIEYRFAETKYTASSQQVLVAPTTIQKDSTKTTTIQDLGGWANLKPDKDKQNILHVNFWLNPKNTVPAGMHILEEDIRVACNGAITYNPVRNATLIAGETFRLTRVEATDATSQATQWFTRTPKKITVSAPGGAVQYYLIDKYGNNADYTIELANRDFHSYKNKSVDLGPITIPLKVRFGYTKNNVDVKSSVEGDLNIGIFAGRSWGRYRIRFESPNELKELSKIRGTLGGFMSLSKVDIDKSNSAATDKPLGDDEKRSMVAFNFGLGAMFSVYNFELSVLMGIDVGTGTAAKSWNFNNRPWLGFGLGYNLNGLWKK